jgi:hypothetical protein
MITPSAEHPPPEQEQPYPGRAVAVAFAKEDADLSIAYLSEREDDDPRDTAGPAIFPGKKVGTFGSQVPVGRAAHPDEITPVLCLLRQRAALQLLLGRGARARRRGDAARVTAE